MKAHIMKQPKPVELTLKKIWKHFCRINRHRFEFFKVAWMAGFYWQALTHDLSKYSLSEFFESAKYFGEAGSPIDMAKADKGYCHAWMHHRGRNPHHYEYWIDNLDNGGEPLVIPYKHAMGMVFDYIAAGKTYLGDKWTIRSPEEYWFEKKKTAKIHPASVEFFDQMFDSFWLWPQPRLGLKKSVSKEEYDRIFLKNRKV